MHLVILLFALFASLFTLQKETLQYAEPFFMVGARMTFAGLVLLALVRWREGRKAFSFNLSAIKHLALLALCNIYLTNIFEIWAIQHMVSSKACLVYSLSPFLAAFVAFIVLKERLSNKKWLGMLIGFLGLLPILFTQTQEEIAGGMLGVVSFAELAIVGAVFFSVYGWICLKKVLSEYGYSPLLANGISMLAGGVLALGHSYLSGESWAPLPITAVQPFVVNSLIMCVISNLICYNLYGYLLKSYTATFMSFAGLVTPLFASLFGYLLLGEQVTWHFFVSVMIFSVGLVIFYREELNQGQGFKVANSAA